MELSIAIQIFDHNISIHLFVKGERYFPNLSKLRTLVALEFKAVGKETTQDFQLADFGLSIDIWSFCCKIAYVNKIDINATVQKYRQRL